MIRSVALSLAFFLGLSASASAGTVFFKNCSALAMADIKVFSQTDPAGSPPAALALAIRQGTQKAFTCDTDICRMTVDYRVRTGWNQSAIRGTLNTELRDGAAACLKPDPNRDGDQLLENAPNGCAC